MASNLYTNQVISRYLFNTDAPPSNLVDKNLIRPLDAVGISLKYQQIGI